MNSRMSHLGSVLCAMALSIACMPALADGRLAYGAPGAPPSQLLEFTASAVRMSQLGSAQWLLYRDQDQVIYLIDDAQRSYQRIDEDLADNLQQQLAKVRAQLEAQLAQLPPEQRAMMKQMMPALPQLAQAKYSVQERNVQRTVNGFACREVVVMKDGEVAEEICLAALKTLDISKRDFALLKRMGKTMGAVATGFGAGSMAAVLEQIEGVPVEHRRPGAAKAEAQLLELNHERQPKQRFELPQAYSERAFFSGLGG